MTGNAWFFHPFRGRGWLLLVVAGLGFTLLYAGFLSFQEHRAGLALEKMRRTDPNGYLEYIRKLEGFDDYVRLFASYQHFDQFRPAAPGFMIGRWTLRATPQRISSLGRTDCTDPIIFGYGRLEIPKDGFAERATFKLDGDTLIVAPSQGDSFRVQLVSYGAAINHLELVPPGRDATFYAYPCEL